MEYTIKIWLKNSLYDYPYLNIESLFSSCPTQNEEYELQNALSDSIEESLALSFQAVNNDRRVQALMGHAMEKAVDDKVAQMKGEWYYEEGCKTWIWRR